MIKGFDGLRAIAVIVVFLNHWTPFGRTYHTGDYGVWLFFLLSGFLIIKGLHRDRLAHESGQAATSLILRFYERRALRIFPAYYATLLVFSIASVFVTIPNWDRISAVYHYLYLSNFYIAHVRGQFIGWFSHFWSLAIEQQFYLLMGPALILVPSRFTKAACVLVICVALASLAYLRINDAPHIQIYTDSLINFGMIALGGLVALYLPGRPQNGSQWTVAALSLVLLAAYPFVLSYFDPSGGYLRGLAQSSVIVAAALIASIYLNQNTAIVKCLEFFPIRHLGRISYGFYLYHNLIPRTLFPSLFMRAGFPDIPPIVSIVLGFLLAVLLAELSWRLLESPILRFKDRTADRSTNSDASLRQSSA